MKFKENLKKLRQNKGLNQEELAKILNVSQEKIRRYEQGKQKTIDLKDLENIINYFEIDYNKLFN